MEITENQTQLLLQHSQKEQVEVRGRDREMKIPSKRSSKKTLAEAQGKRRPRARHREKIRNKVGWKRKSKPPVFQKKNPLNKQKKKYNQSRHKKTTK